MNEQSLKIEVEIIEIASDEMTDEQIQAEKTFVQIVARALNEASEDRGTEPADK